MTSAASEANVTMKKISVLVMLLLVASQLCAHEVTLFPSLAGPNLFVAARYGDPGEYEKIAQIKLLTLDAISPLQHRYSLLKSAAESADSLSLRTLLALPADEPEGVWVLASTYDNGFFVHDANGKAHATTLADYPSARDSAHYFKFSKSLWMRGTRNIGYDRIVGHRLELVPLSDPFGSSSKDLHLQVLYQGRPLPGAEVEIGDDRTASRIAPVISDQRGQLCIPLDHTGWYRLAVTHRSPSRYPELFQDDDITASLIFQR